jgi:ketosteroid isomerase-like protein
MSRTDAAVRVISASPDRAFAALPSGQGVDSAVHWIEAWRSAFDRFTAEVHECVDLGDHVLCVTSWRGVGRQSGLQVGGSGFELYEVREGKIVRALMSLSDKESALGAAGLRN